MRESPIKIIYSKKLVLRASAQMSTLFATLGSTATPTTKTATKSAASSGFAVNAGGSALYAPASVSADAQAGGATPLC